MNSRKRLNLSKNMCRNIYYMLCYAADELQYMEPGEVQFENIQGVDDLLAALLCNSLEILEKNNTLREYKQTNIRTDKPKGRIDFVKSYASGAIANGKLECIYHKLDNDTDVNRVIKFALHLILRYGKDINSNYLATISKSFDNMYGVKLITLGEYNKLPKYFSYVPIYYKPALAASRIVIENILANTYDRDIEQLTELFKLEDDRRYQYIFEKFVRNYYISTLYQKGLEVSKPSYSQYNTHGEVDEYTEVSSWDNPDIVIKGDKKAAVIDTKWYTDKHGIAANKNEVSSYVTDCKAYNENLEEIHGIVLYAQDIGGKIKDMAFNTGGKGIGYNRDIYQRVIDMNTSFDNILKRLDQIALDVFGDLLETT